MKTSKKKISILSQYGLIPLTHEAMRLTVGGQVSNADPATAQSHHNDLWHRHNLAYFITRGIALTIAGFMVGGLYAYCKAPSAMKRLKALEEERNTTMDHLRALADDTKGDYQKWQKAYENNQVHKEDLIKATKVLSDFMQDMECKDGKYHLLSGKTSALYERKKRKEMIFDSAHEKGYIDIELFKRNVSTMEKRHRDKPDYKKLVNKIKQDTTINGGLIGFVLGGFLVAAKKEADREDKDPILKGF